ncbi:28S ribosomal protein S9, mitochondrial [Thrips palmi]|uniref:28S ribosomal protein S9, mitochondrial n=1 Tax=Thrips palmi TaxID=161013 RepID=A0A6P8Y211_THRPL|nr:28S ribosomal protein S9, mitochondrial [Thrips palmi]
MNSLASNVLRCSMRVSLPHGKQAVAYMSKSITDNVSIRKRKTISKAMRSYIDRVKQFEEGTVQAKEEYETGRRFLANIMGEDPATFSAEDVNRAIEYLLPSGLFEKTARPEMLPPVEYKQSAKFDNTGRPFHFLFYTGFPHTYELQHETVKRINKADALLDLIHKKGHTPEKEHQMDLVSTEWKNKKEIQETINECMKDSHFERTMETLESLARHPMSASFSSFLTNYRKPVIKQVAEMKLPSIQLDADGRSFVEATRRRKHAVATVVIRTSGTGKITINGEHDILYFKDVQAREQILYPLQFTGMLEKVDLDITVEGNGSSAQAGAARYATAVALTPLVNEDKRNEMQIAGLLNYDRREAERKKTGKRGARRSYTWLKR